MKRDSLRRSEVDNSRVEPVSVASGDRNTRTQAYIEDVCNDL